MDPYKELNIDKSASQQDIKRAFRKMAQKYHPDKNKGDKTSEAKFKKVNSAYEVLSDPQKRAQYDQFGSMGGDGFSGSQGFHGAQGFNFGGEGFSDIFETFFSGNGGAGGSSHGQRTHNRKARGDDREVLMNITFSESVFGVDKEIELDTLVSCDHCSASGAEPGSKISSCSSCSGTGEIRSVRNTILGQMATSRICEDCKGEGKVPERKCSFCHGRTRTRKKVKHTIKVPQGIDDGSSVRLTGKGDAGIKGGGSGDLYVHIRVSHSKKFNRVGYDIKTVHHIHLLQAVLGDEIKIETVYGDVTLKVPAGTQSHKIFKISGYGIKHLSSDNKGSHFVEIIVDIPQKVTNKEKELYSNLVEEAKLHIKPNKGGSFFSKLF